MNIIIFGRPPPIPMRVGVMDVRSIGQVVVRVKAASKSQRMQLLCTSALLARVCKSITLMTDAITRDTTARTCTSCAFRCGDWTDIPTERYCSSCSIAWSIRERISRRKLDFVSILTFLHRWQMNLHVAVVCALVRFSNYSDDRDW